MSKNSRARATAKAASRGEPLTEPDRFGGIFLSGVIIVLAALAAYHDSFSGPFILDDHGSVTENTSIRHLGSALSLHASSTVSGRPVLNLTFALNYALGGMTVGGYHAINLLVHMLAGLALFGIVRRTLLRPEVAGLRRAGPASLGPNFGTDATLLALAVAVIWVVHPLQTEAVAYISQRAESLMGLFYLLTLYFFVRAAEDNRQQPQALTPNIERRTPNVELPNTNYKLPTTHCARFYLIASVLSCLLGTLCKEIIVTAPVMVLLYDRTFVAGSFRAACRQRWRYYLGLACTWLLLACVMNLKQQSVGFGQGVTWHQYALTSCCSVMHYLKLALWPHPLIFDYGLKVTHTPTTVLLCALALTVLVLCAAMALWRWPAIGFAGAWFFVILAPTTSVVPIIGQPVAENRMYLSLAAVVVLVILVLFRMFGRRSFVLFAIVALGLGWFTVQRNDDYRSGLAIWSDTAAKRPDNARAHNALGMELQEIPGELPEAMSHFETALQIQPDFAEAHSNLGMALFNLPRRLPEAISHFEAALRINPDFAIAHNNLGVALANIPGRMPEAIAHFEAALRINPDYSDAHDNLAAAKAKISRQPPGTDFSAPPGR